MIKKTRKFISATGVAVVKDATRRWESADEVYAHLQERGYQWDQRKGEWIHAPLSSAPPNGESGLVRIRVNANADEIDEIVDWLISAVNVTGSECLEVSVAYPNHRKGTGVRKYLTVNMKTLLEMGQ
jgi:hypothetical protein